MSHNPESEHPKVDPSTSEASAESASHFASGDELEQAIESTAAAREQARPDDELSAAKADLDQAERRVLMAQAELENFRKRMRREMEDERRFASLPLIKDLLGVVDNLQRAIEAAEQSETGGGLLEGVKMVAGQMESILAKHNCQVIDPLGEEFDPNRHEAISQQPSDEHDPGKVSLVYSRGYLLHDRVVRPAQVIVSTGHA